MFETRRGRSALWVALSIACGAVVAACSSGPSTSANPDDASDASVSADIGSGLGGDDAGIVLDTGVAMFEAAPPPPPCDPTCQAAGGTCTAGVCSIVENPGNVDAATQAALEAGGSADATFKWLYPYDKTVFPRRLLPPTLQFGGAAPTAMYVHVTFGTFEYKGYFGASSPARVTLPAASWLAVTEAAKGTDAVKVEVTKTSGGQVTGPIAETWTIAQGSARGTIYYETYGSAMLGGSGSVGIMKIAPGATQPTPFKSGCGNVCHTASANGSTLVAAATLSSSASYDLKNGGATLKAMPGQQFTYGGIYPDGSFVISATNYRTWTGRASRLYDTHTGASLPTPSWDGAVQSGGTPAFSPDGKFVAFNREDTGNGRTLALMTYSASTKTFGGLVDIASNPTLTLAWPAFTPDDKWIIYHAGSNPQFETDRNATGDLYVTDASTHVVTRLDSLDGYAASGSYLPANDPGLNFAPTVLPEAVGGYFWVVFTSHRSYGNTLPSKANNDENGKLWVAAIDLAPKDGVDPSHPAFYLDGQESGADNLRGFWVLDPCNKDGTTCQSGDECCGGYCRSSDAGPPQCTSIAGGCAADYEKCATAADCCNAADLCINGYCATPPPT